MRVGDVWKHRTGPYTILITGVVDGNKFAYCEMMPNKMFNFGHSPYSEEIFVKADYAFSCNVLDLLDKELKCS